MTHQEQPQLLHSSVTGHVLLPSLLRGESVCQRRIQHTLAQEVSHTLTDSLQSAGQELYFSPHLCQELRCFSLKGSSRGRALLPDPLLQQQDASSAGSSGSVTGSRQKRCASTPRCRQSSCTASPCSAARAPPAALGSSSPRCPPRTFSPSPRALTSTLSVAAKLRRNATHTRTNGGPS